MKALEEARVAKTIGSSLGAQVAISGPDDSLEFLRSFGDDLRFLFQTSGVTVGGAADAVTVTVLPAEGTKCQRCWNYTNDVGTDAEWPGACARCARAVRLIVAESAR
jgi:isoleucyl-tRNA synthetase